MVQKDTKSNVLKILVILFVFLLTFGTVGFILLKGLTLWEAFYQTLIILFTHFYHQIEEPRMIQILILILIVGSLVIVAYVIKFFAEYVFEGTLKETRRKRNMKKTVDNYHDHYIVCGYGRVGRQIADELREEKVSFVIADRDPVRINEAIENGFMTVKGCPTEEKTLMKAGIMKAKAVIVAIGAEVNSLYVVLSARALNPDIYIVARAGRAEGVSKIKKAGADKVMMPEQIAGYHMATMALRPAVVDFLNVIVDGKHEEIQIEELRVGHGSELINRPLSFFITEKCGNNVNVLAISRNDDTTALNPSGNEIVALNDTLILMGSAKNLQGVTDKVLA